MTIFLVVPTTVPFGFAGHAPIATRRDSSGLDLSGSEEPLLQLCRDLQVADLQVEESLPALEAVLETATSQSVLLCQEQTRVPKTSHRCQSLSIGAVTTASDGDGYRGLVVKCPAHLFL